MNDGFTFLETLVALLVAGILALAAGSAVIHSLRAEMTADWARAGAFFSQTIASEFYLGTIVSNACEVSGATWGVAATIVAPNRREPDSPAWRVYVLAPAARPSQVISVCLRLPEPAGTR